MIKNLSILIHYTHRETLGHTTRIVSLSHALLNLYGPHIRLTILQGGVRQPFIKFPSQVKLIHIPNPFDTRASFKGFYKERHTKERTDFILKTAQKVKPDIFITEFFPFGRQEYLAELLPTICYLKEHKSHIYASIGYPLLTCLSHPNQKWIARLLNQVIKLYDKLLIHCPPKLENPYHLKALNNTDRQKQYRQFFAAIKNQIYYTGYILPYTKPTKRLTQKTTKKHCYNVVISRGGGSVYPKVIASSILAQPLLGNNYHLTIVCGPATSAQEKKLFQQLLRKANPNKITLYYHLPDLDQLIQTCSVSVSLCGYNTSVQLLRYGTPCVIIPYQNAMVKEPTGDQAARSKLLKDYLPCTVLSYANLSPLTLANAIRQQCENAPSHTPAPDRWFCGAQLSAQIICEGTEN